MPTSGTGGGVEVEPALVEELDDVAGWKAAQGAARAAAREGSWRPSRRAGAVAALVVALTGLVTHSTRAAAPAALDPAAVLALQVTIPTGAVAGPGVPGVGGWSRYSVAVPVVNQGPDPVSVTVLGVDAPHQRTARVPAPVQVAPDSALTVDLPLEVRCADVPAPGAAAGVPPARTPGTAALARVALPGRAGGVRVRLPWEQHGGDSFTQQLWTVCVPRRV